MTDWLAVCRDAVEDVRGVLVELPTRDEREPVVGDGEGGDETTAIGAAAERVILERLKGIEGTTIVSEEVGILSPRCATPNTSSIRVGRISTSTSAAPDSTACTASSQSVV